MKPAKFTYFRPRTASEAIAMIASAGEDARFLAGGQSLVPMMNFRIARPTALIDLNDCADLEYVREQDGVVRLGAMLRQRAAEVCDTVRRACPLVAEALSHAGPVTVRNRATVGGTIANGYPVAELPVVALCLGAEMVLTSGQGERRIRASDFFLMGMVTAIKTGELLQEILLPAATPASRFGFAERGNHAGGAALAIAAACGERDADGRFSAVKIAVAGLQTVPVRLSQVEAAVMVGDSIDDAFTTDITNLEEAGDGLDADREQRNLVRTVIEDSVARLRADAGAH